MNRSLWFKVALTVLLAVTLLRLGLCFRPSASGRAVRQVFDAFDEELDWQVEQLLPYLGSGDSVVLLTMNASFNTEHATNRYERIRRTLNRAGVDIREIHNLAADMGPDWFPTSVTFPYADYLRLAQMHPDVKAFLSLSGPPSGVHDEQPRASDARPPLLLTRVDEMSPSLLQMVQDGRILAAVALNSGPEAENIDPADFDRKYKIWSR